MGSILGPHPLRLRALERCAFKSGPACHSNVSKHLNLQAAGSSGPGPVTSEREHAEFASRREHESDYSLSEWTLLTGFPGPISYPKRSPDSSRKATRPEAGEQVLQYYGQDVQPVFRSSPFSAEVDRKCEKRTHARILFLDEGNCCRSVVAEAMFHRLLGKMAASGSPLSVSVESASLGPAFREHDPRVERLAREAGLSLPARSSHCFDEVKDMVDYDLVLVMDKFDFDEVMREVAVLDTINPGGFYAARVRQFGQFAAAGTHFRADKAPWALNEGIADPLYANPGGEEGQAALWTTLRKLRLACAGLAQHLTQLQSRCVAGTSLQEALAQALLCPLLEPGNPAVSWQVPEKGQDWRPVWQGNSSGQTDSQLYSIRRNGTRNFIVRRPHPYYKVDRGYWRELDNLRKELKGWMEVHSCCPERLPSSRELRATGANAICNAIENHGGFYAVAKKLGLQPTKLHQTQRWMDLDLLRQELVDFVVGSSGAVPSELAMPSLGELKKHGRADLATAIAKLGGIAHAAEQCGFCISHTRWQQSHRPRNSTRSASLVHTRQVLWECCPQAMRDGRMPSRTELVDQGHKKLTRDIRDLGGFKAVADMLGLAYSRASRNTSKQWQAAHGLTAAGAS